ncbi:MAG: DUF4386 domain-containing protein [Candidatus Zixiibacteriota bacterium]|jgi:hypothetical protein
MPTVKGETSPLVYARAAGVLFLVILACSILSMLFVSSRIVVPGDAAATADNIVASESLFRAGIAGEAVVFLCEIALTVLLYALFRPVSKTLSLTAAFARLAMTVLQGVNTLIHITALVLLTDTVHATAFGTDQLNAIVLMLFNAYGYGELVWGAFFGLHCLVLGYLIFKSGYFPRVLGVLMALASLGYLSDSFGSFLFSGYQEELGWIVFITAFVGELPFFFWLLFRGLNVQKWRDRAVALS